MVEKVYPMTLEGKEKLEKELEELKTVKRGEIIERIKIARGFEIFPKTLNMNQRKMNKHLLKEESQQLKI